MPAYLPKPQTPIWQPGHPLSSGARLIVPLTEGSGPPRDLVGGTTLAMGSGASWERSPYGPAMRAVAAGGIAGGGWSRRMAP